MKLITINGPCGIGKSTLSEKIHANMPLSFLLDIDAQRRFISQYREKKEESGKIMMTISKAIIKSCLEDDRDIIIDKIMLDNDVLDFYYEIAKIYGADVYEIILWAPKEVVMKRANERGWREGGLLTPEKCEIFWDKIDVLKNTRPQAHIINIDKMSEDETYLEVAKIL
ncbi:MAG: AAA family ATPase [Parcubacteria group bacterium]|jgi:predicted kinase